MTPRASRASVGPVKGGALVVRVTAPPVEGAANTAVLAALAAALGLRRSEVALESGARARLKLVSVPASARAALERLA